MSKYNYEYEVEIEDFSSIGQILGMIEPSSIVLEFGCANGIMTKFMKEKLNCSVHIVEIDKEAYEDAREFAVDGYCGDIEKYEWLEKFRDIKFDYILFADVLEHLYRPQKVISSVKELLKDDGRLIFSVPNIAHGDMLINIYNNQFTYTSLGLLDDTHIRFFTYNSLKPFAENAGYSIVREQYTSRPLFTTEQAEFISDKEREKYETIVSEHPLNDAYQFICALEKKEYAEKNKTEVLSTIEKINDKFETHIYLDYGEGFFSKQKEVFYTEKRDDSKYKFRIKIPKNVKAIRFDPIERYKCIVKDFDVASSDKKYSYVNLNGIQLLNIDLFDTTDPQIYIQLDIDDDVYIEIEATIIPISLDIWTPLVAILNEQKQTYTNHIEEVRKETSIIKNELEIKVNQLDAVNLAKQDVENALQIKIEQLDAVNLAKQDVENALQIKIEQLDAVNVVKQDVENALQIKIEQLDAVNVVKQDVENALQIKMEQLDAVNIAKQDVENALQIKIEQLDAVNVAKQDVENALQIKIEQLDAVNIVKGNLEKLLIDSQNEIVEEKKYIEKCEQMILDLHREIQQKHEEYNELNKKYISVTQSVIWKIAIPFRKIRNKLLKNGKEK